MTSRQNPHDEGSSNQRAEVSLTAMGGSRLIASARWQPLVVSSCLYRGGEESSVNGIRSRQHPGLPPLLPDTQSCYAQQLAHVLVIFLVCPVLNFCFLSCILQPFEICTFSLGVSAHSLSGLTSLPPRYPSVVLFSQSSKSQPASFQNGAGKIQELTRCRLVDRCASPDDIVQLERAGQNHQRHGAHCNCSWRHMGPITLRSSSPPWSTLR